MTWSEFDHAATNLAHRLLALGVAPGDRVAVWHKDTSAIHVLLVAIERCGAVDGWARRARGRARGGADPADRAAGARWSATSSGSQSAQQAAADADPALRVVALGDDSPTAIDTTPRPDGDERPVARRGPTTSS